MRARGARIAAADALERRRAEAMARVARRFLVDRSKWTSFDHWKRHWRRHAHQMASMRRFVRKLTHAAQSRGFEGWRRAARDADDAARRALTVRSVLSRLASARARGGFDTWRVAARLEAELGAARERLEAALR